MSDLVNTNFAKSITTQEAYTFILKDQYKKAADFNEYRSRILMIDIMIKTMFSCDSKY